MCSPRTNRTVYSLYFMTICTRWIPTRISGWIPSLNSSFASVRFVGMYALARLEEQRERRKVFVRKHLVYFEYKIQIQHFNTRGSIDQQQKRGAILWAPVCLFVISSCPFLCTSSCNDGEYTWIRCWSFCRVVEKYIFFKLCEHKDCLVYI